MKRLVAITALVLSAIATVAIVVGVSSDPPYQVRAIFDHAGYLIPGEDVRVAGVKVGQISDVAVTPNNKAAIVLNITDRGYQDFREDASCMIRPQSLLGEKFVECKPTQARPPGSALPPPLGRISEGEGKGQRLLPLVHTGKAVDLDLVNNIMRRPYSERLSLIINELGTGLAGRGSELTSVIRRADPALQDFDRVAALLAQQNQALAAIARDSDAVLSPLGRERQHVSGFIDHAATVGEATVQRRVALKATLSRLPRFLAELRPTMERLGGLSDQMTPVIDDVGAVAPSINQFVTETGPFARAAGPAVRSLGKASVVGTRALTNARPTIHKLREFTHSLRPVANTLAPVLESLRKTGGIERLMDFVFYEAGSVNGFDGFGHYIRASLVVNTCSNFATQESQECLAKFAPMRSGGKKAKRKGSKAAALDPRAMSAGAVGSGPASAPPRTVRGKHGAAKPDKDAQMLDYLLGNDGK